MGLSNYLKLLDIGDSMSSLLEQPKSLILHIFGIGDEINNLLEMLGHHELDIHAKPYHMSSFWIIYSGCSCLDDEHF